MKNPLLISALALASALCFVGAASAQVAGSTAASVTLTEVHDIALGWSVKNSLLGKTVYTEDGKKIGTVQDLIIAPDKKLSYLIIGAGGFVGIGRHDVAIAATQVTQHDGRLVMTGATQDAVRLMPRFDYASDTTRRAEFAAKAEVDIQRGRDKIAELEKQAQAATSDAKTKLNQQITGLKHDLARAEQKLAAMKHASAKSWQTFVDDVNAATERLRKSLAVLVG